MATIDWQKVNKLLDNDKVSQEDLENLFHLDIDLAQIYPSIRDDLKPYFLQAQENLEAMVYEKYEVTNE